MHGFSCWPVAYAHTLNKKCIFASINLYSSFLGHIRRINFSIVIPYPPGLVDRVLALHTGSRGLDSHRGHMSERFFRSNRPGYPHPVSSELENSDIRVAVGDCSVTEHRQWGLPYQTDKTVHVHAKTYKHNKDGCTALGVCGNGSVPLSHSGERRYENWNIHTSVILSLDPIVSTPPVSQ